jgi:hypothetical protein
VAKLHQKAAIKASEPQEAAEAMHTAIQTFLSTCRNAAVLEYGEEIMPLKTGQYAIEVHSDRLWIEIWTETRNISRRILSIERHATGVLDCTVQRFGGRPGKLSFLDLDRPQTAHRSLVGLRSSFAEQFRRMLFRQFPGWEIATLSCGLDLQRSFSSVFPRARLTRGNQQIAATACAAAQQEPRLLASALIWYDYLRSHAPSGTHTSLALFLPDTAGNLTAHRLRWLSGETLEVRLFRFSAHGSAGEVDPRDLGNLETKVQATACHTREVKGISAHAERCLEVAVRCNLTTIEPSLQMNPVHGQVLAFSAGDRDVIDLLAVSPRGRLAVIELKVTEDIHLPLQALDYWMRVAWHAERGELQHLFPGTPLERRPPRLMLIAPAMAFHPSNATILRYFSSEIEVERIGVSSDWQRHFRVVLRLNGAEAPISHGGT